MVPKSGCPVTGHTAVYSGHTCRITYSRPGFGFGNVSSVLRGRVGMGPPNEPGSLRDRSRRGQARDSLVRLMKNVFLETYGCQMNVADSELMAGVLERAGMQLVARPEDADAVILNTCAIREHAEQRVLGRLGEFAHLKNRNPDLIVGVAGCMAQHLRKRLLDHK